MRSGVHTDFHLPQTPEPPKASTGLLASLTATTCPGCSTGPHHRACAGCGEAAVVALQADEHSMSLCRRCERLVLDMRCETAEHRGCEPAEPLIYVAGVSAERLAQQAAARADAVAQRIIQRTLLVAATMPSNARQPRGPRYRQQRRTAPAAVEAPSLWGTLADVQVAQPVA